MRIDFSKFSMKELVLFLVVAVLLIFLVFFIVRGALISNKLDTAKLEIMELNSKQSDLRRNYEHKKLKLENEIFSLIAKQIEWKEERTEIQQQIEKSKAKEKTLQQQLKKLKDEIAKLEKPNVNYRDSSIVAIDSLLPK